MATVKEFLKSLGKDTYVDLVILKDNNETGFADTDINVNGYSAKYLLERLEPYQLKAEVLQAGIRSEFHIFANISRQV